MILSGGRGLDKVEGVFGLVGPRSGIMVIKRNMRLTFEICSSVDVVRPMAMSPGPLHSFSVGYLIIFGLFVEVCCTVGSQAVVERCRFC